MKSKLPFLALITLSAFLIFWRINDHYIAFTDELLFEEASYRMFASNATSPFPNISWLVPINDNRAWLEKPPLYFWLTAPIFWLFNQLKSIYPLTENLMPNGEFAYPWIRRFWTTVAGVAIVGFTYGIAKLLLILKDNRTQPRPVYSPWRSAPAKTGVASGDARLLEKVKNNSIPLLSIYLLLASPLFLATTKSASLDLTATAFMTGAIYFYLKNKLLLNSSKVTPTRLPIKMEGIILPAILIALGLLTRSFLALTPIGLIIADQTINPPNRWQFKHWLTFIITILLITLPWHIAIYLLYPQDFLQTYLGFNIVKHAIQLTPGYQQTQPYYYIIELIKNIPWLLPFLTAGTLFLQYFKKSLKRNNKITKKQSNSTIIFLFIWFLLPLLTLSLASTRHTWYIVQITPPLSILMASLLFKTYQTISVCSTCLTLKYLSQITFIVFTLANILSVLTVADPSTPTIQAVRWARQNLTQSQILYTYKQAFLPITLLFSPAPVSLITDLSRLPTDSYIFIADIHLNQALQQTTNIEPIQNFKLGNIYQLSIQK